jgi:hypothetical protein
MNTEDFLKQVAYLKSVPMEGLDDSDIPKSWLSKFDDSYITFEGMEKDIGFLAEHEITEELTHGVGFSPKDNKWYGWSHRAMFGFTIDSTCKKGDCHYMAKDKDDYLEDMIRFWDDECHLETTGIHDRQEIMHSKPINPGDPEQKSVPSGEFEDGVTVSWKYDNKVPNESIRGTISSCFSTYPDKWGNGEWVAKTMADAKQMAIDFNQGVS